MTNDQQKPGKRRISAMPAHCLRIRSPHEHWVFSQERRNAGCAGYFQTSLEMEDKQGDRSREKKRKENVAPYACASCVPAQNLYSMRVAATQAMRRHGTYPAFLSPRLPLTPSTKIQNRRRAA